MNHLLQFKRRIFKTLLTSILLLVGCGQTAAPLASFLEKQKVSPQNLQDRVLVVYNRDSARSIELAEFYAKLRDIQPANLVGISLENLPQHKIQLRDYKSRVLLPLMGHIKQMKMPKKIHAVVYSVDIPTAVDFREYYRKKTGRDIWWRSPPVASLSSLTFYYQSVLNDDLEYFFHFRTAKGPVNPYYTEQADKAISFADSGLAGKYLLSSFLGVSRAQTYWGFSIDYNTLQEIKDSLQRSFAADHSNPNHNVFLIKNSDVRTSLRLDQYKTISAKFGRMGYPSTYQRLQYDWAIPKRTLDITGLTTGTSSLEDDSGSTFAPGALVDNLTSSGAKFHQFHRQTTIAQFIRMGAAGASGTVVEPLLIMDKFPNASLHYFYAQGRTMIESYYLSTKRPQQLLIVGDPLCRPYDNFAQFRAKQSP